MNNALRPYGELGFSGLVAKFGMKKTPDLELSGKRVVGLERIGARTRDL